MIIMASSSSSSSILVVVQLFLIFFSVFLQPSVSILPIRTRFRNEAAVINLNKGEQEGKPLVFPLRTEKISSTSTPPATAIGRQLMNKLLFHHNVTLTVTLPIGTPPQNVSMVLDTGSELSWLPCSNSYSSTNGLSKGSVFFPRSSRTYKKVPCRSPVCTTKARDLPAPSFCNSSTNTCQVSLSYADASTAEGVLASDVFHLSGSSENTVFGCMDKTYSSTPQTQNQGLLGMNRGALSFITQTNMKKFSYCISDKSNSGILVLGGGSGSTNTAAMIPLNYTPLVQPSFPLPYFDPVAYSVQLESIHVGSKLLPIPKSVLLPDHTGAGQTMVDSGSQFTFLLGEAYTVLQQEFLRQTSGLLRRLNEPDFVFQGAFDTCFTVEEKFTPAWEKLPAVILGFAGGAKVVVASERLLYHVAGEERGRYGVWCLTFGNSDLVPMEAYIVGHHHQMNVWVEFDLENGRLGFGPVRCDLASQRLGLFF